MLKSLATGSLPDTIAEDSFMNGAAEIPAFLQTNAVALGLDDPDYALMIQQVQDALTAYPATYNTYKTKLDEYTAAKAAYDAAKTQMNAASKLLEFQKTDALETRMRVSSGLEMLLAASLSFDNTPPSELSEAEQAQLKARQNALLPVWQGSRVFWHNISRPEITAVRRLSGTRHVVEWIQPSGGTINVECFEVLLDDAIVKTTSKTVTYLDIAPGSHFIKVRAIGDFAMGTRESNPRSYGYTG